MDAVCLDGCQGFPGYFGRCEDAALGGGLGPHSGAGAGGQREGAEGGGVHAERGVDEAGAEDGGAHAGCRLPQLQVEGLGEADDRVHGAGVGGAAGEGAEAACGCRVQNVAGAALDQERGEDPDAVDDAEHLDVDHPFPGGGILLPHGGGGADDAGVVADEVGLAVGGQCGVGDGADLCLVGDVRFDRGDVGTAGPE